MLAWLDAHRLTATPLHAEWRRSAAVGYGGAMLADHQVDHVLADLQAAYGHAPPSIRQRRVDCHGMALRQRRNAE